MSVIESFEKNVTPRELEETLRLEYRSKFLNPKWAEVTAIFFSEFPTNNSCDAHHSIHYNNYNNIPLPSSFQSSYVQAMSDQGAGGAYEISSRMTALIGWAATTDFAEKWVSWYVSLNGDFLVFYYRIIVIWLRFFHYQPIEII